MADRGFFIADELKTLNLILCLILHSSTSGRDQLTKTEVKETQSIASVHTHVERALRRIKTFRLIRNKIRLAFHVSIHQLLTVDSKDYHH